MLTIRTLVLGASFLLAGAGVSSCLTAPDYPDTPSIEFEKITSQRVTNSSGTYDSVRITISYRDGDGDLGLNNDGADALPPYAYLNPDRTLNKYTNNYFLQPQLKDKDGNFQNINLEGYSSRYPRITADDRKEPIRGTLNFDQKLTVGLPFYSGQTIRFRVSIADRALNESNEVFTDPITIQ
ncbi:hypothetical protein [Hymenobacter defluvii]|uniref:DUF3823 domain-containing protein n=1 Tax=Hymenobacter defluvii TaxID=2054411 RepID=A0ABS3T631_9BACT|nr:hypothetical protein [Hymenobacter defluvii]MBO3269110.1 hypothetical protein [Hymenobacter defluvii]